MTRATAPARRRRIRWPHLLGGLVAAGGAGWVIVQVIGAGADLTPPAPAPVLVMVGLVAVGAYVALTFVLAAAWWWATGALGPRAPMVATVAVWTRAQIARYIPGNVFHYVGRQALGRRLGLGHESLLAAHFLELVSVVGAACLVGLARGLREPALGGGRLPLLVAGLVAVLLVLPLVDRALRAFGPTARRMSTVPRLSTRTLVTVLAPTLLLHGVFIVAMGYLLLFLVRTAWQVPVAADRVVWLYALAWTAGTLSPGAPGGLGVREAALSLGLAGAIGDGRAAAVAIALRLITVLGDVVAAILGSLVPLPDPPPHAPVPSEPAGARTIARSDVP